MLDAIVKLDATHPLDLIPTFLGAHTVPPEYRGRTDEYVNYVIEEMLPIVAAWRDQHPASHTRFPLFCDVFCEAGVFDLEESSRVLKAGKALGMTPKIHADEFKNLGGVKLATEVEAISADHLDVTPPDDRPTGTLKHYWRGSPGRELPPG